MMFAYGFVFNPTFPLMHWWSAVAATLANLALTNLTGLAVLVCLLINDVLFTFLRLLPFVSVFRCCYMSGKCVCVCANVCVTVHHSFRQSINSLLAVSCSLYCN